MCLGIVNVCYHISSKVFTSFQGTASESRVLIVLHPSAGYPVADFIAMQNLRDRQIAAVSKILTLSNNSSGVKIIGLLTVLDMP